MSTKSKFPACDVGLGLSHIDNIAIGNILTTISVIAPAVLIFAYIQSRPIAQGEDMKKRSFVISATIAATIRGAIVAHLLLLAGHPVPAHGP